jgi:hypothetical protein
MGAGRTAGLLNSPCHETQSLFYKSKILPKLISGSSALFSVAWDSTGMSHSSLSEEKEDSSADSVT